MPISEFSKPRASLICVGSELLRGKINTHASTLARDLASVGVELTHEHTVADDLEDLTRTIRLALKTDPVVIVTGGLGPTFDDLTREAAAQALGRTLVYSPALFKEIFKKFKRARLKKMPPANKRQAFLVEGALPIANPVGTAPGQWLALKDFSPLQKLMILLPGPPSELIPMVQRFVLPQLRRAYPPRPTAEAHLHFIGVPESIVDQRIRPVIDREKGVQFTILAHLGLVDFDIFVTDSSQVKARRRLESITKRILAKMGRAFYGRDDDYPLEKVILKRFVGMKATLSVAESCTGGMLSKRLTDVAGSSSYFKGGVVSYSDSVKISSLGVSPDTLRAHGAVSKETAAAMAHGVRDRCKSTWGLGITGIAGPGGATPGKPVGLVYLSLSGPRSTRTLELHLRGSRDAIRERSVIAALDLLRLIGTVDRA